MSGRPTAKRWLQLAGLLLILAVMAYFVLFAAGFIWGYSAGKKEEVANVVAFLASEASSYLTGQAINITGGQLMEC